ncbi:MAG TPA: AMP-binding protein, partial [Bacteroidia bacterium]
MSNNKTGFCPEHDEQDICSGFLYWYDKTPDVLALFINDKGYSYKEVYAAAYSIYKEIKQYKEDRIGVWCENDVYSYAAILAISMSGACYVPLNAKFPVRKLNTIIADCGLKLVISGNDLNENDFFADIKIVSPVLDFKQAGEIEKTIEQPLAYILYTSGTTGLPKGVPVKKSSVNSFFTYFIRQFDFKPS